MNYNKHYDALVQKCRNRVLAESEYTETHHIIPRCLGGKDEPDNLVKMKPEEHFVAHQLLCKIYPDSHGLAKALSAMCRSSSKNPRTNKWYSWIRKRYSRSVSGENNVSAKFTNKQVLDIYYSCEHMDALAEKYGVKRYNIITIKRKIYYRCVTEHITELPGYCEHDIGPGKTRPIPIDLIKEIYLDTGDYEYFKNRYNATQAVVKSIKSRKSFKRVTQGLGDPGQVKRYGLSYDDVTDIRNSELDIVKLAEKYNVNIETIRNIRNRTTRMQIWDDF